MDRNKLEAVYLKVEAVYLKSITLANVVYNKSMADPWVIFEKAMAKALAVREKANVIFEKEMDDISGVVFVVDYKKARNEYWAVCKIKAMAAYIKAMPVAT